MTRASRALVPLSPLASHTLYFFQPSTGNNGEREAGERVRIAKEKEKMGHEQKGGREKGGREEGERGESLDIEEEGELKRERRGGK